MIFTVFPETLSEILTLPEPVFARAAFTPADTVLRFKSPVFVIFILEAACAEISEIVPASARAEVEPMLPEVAARARLSAVIEEAEPSIFCAAVKERFLPA